MNLTVNFGDEIENIIDILEFGVAGVVTERDGNLIKGFDLKSVSIQCREDRKQFPKPIDKDE